MHPINKNNFISTLCISFTCLVFLIVITEALQKGLNATHLNIILAFVGSFIGVFILSQHSRFDRFPPIIMIILQYLIALGMVLLFIWISGFFMELHPDAYGDMARSFSIPYFIGAVLYYMELYRETKKQNEDLKIIKKLKEADDIRRRQKDNGAEEHSKL